MRVVGLKNFGPWRLSLLLSTSPRMNHYLRKPNHVLIYIYLMHLF